MSKNVQDLVVGWQWYREEGAVKGDSKISGLPTIDQDRKPCKKARFGVRELSSELLTLRCFEAESWVRA